MSQLELTIIAVAGLWFLSGAYAVSIAPAGRRSLLLVLGGPFSLQRALMASQVEMEPLDADDADDIVGPDDDFVSFSVADSVEFDEASPVDVDVADGDEAMPAVEEVETRETEDESPVVPVVPVEEDEADVVADEFPTLVEGEDFTPLAGHPVGTVEVTAPAASEMVSAELPAACPSCHRSPARVDLFGNCIFCENPVVSR